MHVPYGGTWAWSWLMMLGMALFWIIVLGLILWMISSAARRTQPPMSHGESALDILKKRYARGEISREEFERMKQEVT